MLAGDAAHVGNVAIPAALVAAVATSRGEVLREALDQLVEDALLAQAARASGVESEPATGWASTATLARTVLERLADEARSRGAPTDEELATVRVIHAVVLRSSSVPRARARAVADAILRAETGVRDDDDFEKRAHQVAQLGVSVTVERLPEFDLTGRTAEGTEIDPGFVAASFALRTHGELSEVVESPFGWHVIRLISRVGPDPESIERLRRDFSVAVQGMRVRSQLNASLREKRSRVPVDVSGDAVALMMDAAQHVP